MRRFLNWGLVGLLLVNVVIVGCAGRRAKRLSVGVTLLTKQHIFYQDLEKGLREAAKEHGVRLKIQSAEFDPALQMSQVENFVVAKVDAIVVCPTDSKAVGGAIKRANEAGIPVFTADIAALEGEVVSHIASDNVRAGELAGEYMAKLLDGKGKIIIIDHPVVTSVRDRVKGFISAIKRYKGIKIVARPPADGQRAKAMDVMETMLRAHPDVKGVFGINDDSALGALAAIRATGRKDIVVIGYDATPEAVDEILKGGLLKADAAQYPEIIGKTTIETVVKHFEGKPVPKFIPIKVDIVDKESLSKEKGGKK